MNKLDNRFKMLGQPKIYQIPEMQNLTQPAPSIGHSAPLLIRHINEWVYVGYLVSTISEVGRPYHTIQGYATGQIYQDLRIGGDNTKVLKLKLNNVPPEADAFLAERINNVISIMHGRIVSHGWLQRINANFSPDSDVTIEVRHDSTLTVAEQSLSVRHNLKGALQRIDNLKRLIQDHGWYATDFAGMINEAQKTNTPEFNYLGVAFDIELAKNLLKEVVTNALNSRG